MKAATMTSPTPANIIVPASPSTTRSSQSPSMQEDPFINFSLSTNQRDALGLATYPGFYHTSMGRQDQEQVLLKMKLEIAKQQEKVDFLDSKLNHCHKDLGPGDGLRCKLSLGKVEPQTKYSEKRTVAMRKSSKGQFPVKLYAMLELADVQGYGSSSNAVVWLPHGRAFRVLDGQRFVESSALLFFRQTTIRSFYRQLNYWGFKRLSKGRDAGVWYHELFVRGSPSEIRKMVRNKVKRKSKSNNPFADHEEPGFYSTPATLPRSIKPAIELLDDDDDFVEVYSSSSESANGVQYSDKQFTGLDELKHKVISDYNMQHVYVPSPVALSNDLNLCQRPPQAVATTIFPSCHDVQSNSPVVIEPLPFNDDVRYDDFAQYIDSMIHTL